LCNGGGRSWGSQGTRVEGRQILGAEMTGSETREETEVRLQEKTFYLPETESDRIQENA
jgi:hypothetical protein